MMTSSEKDQLVCSILVLQNSITNQRDDQEICFTFHQVISKLLFNDGFTTILNPSTDTSNFDFMCFKEDSRDRICISLQNSTENIAEERVRERVSYAFNYPYDRLIMFAPIAFTASCYRFVNMTDPLKVELLTLDILKSWTSKIEIESDLSINDYENIIKISVRLLLRKLLRILIFF